MNNIDMQKRILEIFDYSYANSPIRIPAKTCKEVGKILHVGMFLEESLGQIPGFSYSDKDLKQLQGKNTILTNDVAQFVRTSFVKMNKKWKLYDDGINFTDINIGYIVGKLNNIYISDPNKDVFGDALELFRSQWAKQEGGQFFTDQRVTSLAVSMVDFNPNNGDTLIDLCSGTGGFLLAGLNKIKKIADNLGEDEKFVTTHAKKSLNGFEIDESVAELGNATLSGRTGSSTKLFINTANSLDNNNSKKSYSKAVTNPPFGAKISIQDDYILSQYQLARISNSNCNDRSITSTKLFKRAPDVLFIERNINVLNDGGILGIILPYQILSGPQTYYVRNWILKHTKIIAVIDLPAETFQPHTGTKTCLLVVEKLSHPLSSLQDIESYDIFMASPKWIGHDRRGNTVFKKGIDGKETSEVLTDFPELESSFLEYKRTGDLTSDYDLAHITNSRMIINDELLRLNSAFYSPEYSSQIKNMDSLNFEMVPLSDLVERVFFPGRFKRNYVERYDQAVPFLGGTNITQMIDHTNKWFRHDDPKLKHLTVKEGWLLITRSGTTGIVSSVPAHWDGYAISEHVIRIIPNGKVDPNYLLAFLKTPQCQAALAQGVFGSVIDEITPETIESIQVPIPKDQALYKSISKRVLSAEKARSKSLSEFYGAIEDLTLELGA
jgi:type I restriction enzyme M protein